MEEFASEDAGDAMAKAETESFDPRLALMALMALKDTRATNCLSLENWRPRRAAERHQYSLNSPADSGRPTDY